MQPSFLQRIAGQSDVLMAVGIIGLVAMMVIPLPPVLLDLLLTLNIASALCILLVSMYVQKPLDFSVFPSLLLVATLFRLALNVSSTRLILLHGAAGKVIEAFGQFVVGGDIVVGLILFLILVVIQFVVITNGAGRVAEVAARFTLDEMPGKQMAIDADLNAGLVGEAEAKHRRREVEREADFYGAMDGASKFVRGDAIAGIIIVIVNIIGGIIIGATRLHMPVAEALQRFALLTVGDGLVSQIPALLISTATGLVVTRAASEENLGSEVREQLVAQPRAIMIVGAMLVAFSFVPGLPRGVFISVGALTALLAWRLMAARRREEEEQEAASAVAPSSPSRPAPGTVEDALHVDRIAVRIGYGLLNLADPESGDLLDRITGVRKQIAQDLGLIVPAVRVRDDVALGPHEYTISIRDAVAARGKLRPPMLLAINPHHNPPPIPGEDTVEPAFGLPAKWIRQHDAALAEARGYTVVDCSTVMATHLSETIKNRAADILSRQDVQDMVDGLREREPAAVNDVIPDLATTGQVQQVLRRLLAESVPIRDLATILEAMADGIRSTGNLEDAVELCRLALSRVMCGRYADEEGSLKVIAIHPDLERRCVEATVQTTQGPVCGLQVGVAMRVLTRIRDLADQAIRHGQQPVIIASPQARRAIRSLTARDFASIPVISHIEVPPGVNIQVLGQVEAEAELAVA
jgi:flagellar biosynthesis protein FlhA